MQLATAFLGQLDKEPGVFVWHSQVAHCRLVSINCCTDVHGQLLHARTTTWKGLLIGCLTIRIKIVICSCVISSLSSFFIPSDIWGHILSCVTLFACINDIRPSSSHSFSCDLRSASFYLLRFSLRMSQGKSRCVVILHPFFIFLLNQHYIVQCLKPS